MAEDLTQVQTLPDAAIVAADEKGERRSRRGEGAGRSERKGSSRPRREAVEREFDQTIIDLARVTRVMAGGKRMRFRATVVIGDRKGRVGLGTGKALDVSEAINKAVNSAKKDLITIPLFEGTLPHEVHVKLGAAKILLKPASDGTGIIAGGAVRSVLDLGGVPNVAAKMLGSRNKLNNARATIKALKSLQPRKARKK